MKMKSNRSEELKKKIDSKEKTVLKLKSCRHSPYDYAFLSFGGNVGTNQHELNVDIIDILIENYKKDIEVLTKQKDEMGMD
jgi:hypothetical protein